MPGPGSRAENERLYRRVSPQVSFPQLEEAVLARWRDLKVFARSLEQRTGAPEWVFYEGPPTANGRPGIHHVEARSFKDLFCRFQTMRGHLVARKAGWDCHGLPVEIAVEKQLGITQKREIEERVGVAEFVRLCRESVQLYVDEWERLTDRIGFWLDMEDAYWTMSAPYIESVWWLLEQIWDQGLLQEDFRVVPYCPRCETSLSSHEQHYAGAYRTVADPSVYVRFPLADEPATSLLVWTTTPWTLLANLAVAVGPELTYAEVDDPGVPGRRLVVALDAVERLLGEGVRVHRTFSGADLVGGGTTRYAAPFGFVEPAASGHTVRPGDFVSAEDGSGLVHLAPYGQEDMAVAKRDGLPIVQMIDPSGRVVAEGGAFAGLWVKDADPRIIEDLERRDLLFRTESYEHSYPHCWRCATPLLYYPRKDWYIRTSQRRAELQAANETTDWYPETIKHGRFGDWLANNVDWSLSRDRYWGTPLPIWRCDEGHAVCVGSLADLGERAGRDLRDLDPHRPHIDEVLLECAECGAPSHRVKSVIDVWFDSGSMPFAQWHYPFENEDLFERRFPAHFISEAVDQTRGWFYSLLAIAALVRGENSFRNCVVLGLLLDGEGRKMSKSLGNVLDPWVVLEGQGADALRWYFFTGGSPWADRRASVDIVQEALRRYLLTLWNTYSFWVTYADLEGFDPGAARVPVADRPELDRWVLAELDDTIRTVTDALEDFDGARGGRRLDRFVDDLSNWYVRRSRRRFWRSKADVDTRAAFLTLWECLVDVAKLTAPFTPFVADEIFTNLTGPVESAPDSVHLTDWPAPDEARRDDALRSRMALARRLVTLGRSARTDAQVRVRQPLARALVVVPSGEVAHLAGLEELVAEELNVKSIDLAHDLGELVSYSVKPNFRALGPRFGPRVKSIAATLAEADAGTLVAALERDGRASLEVEGESVTLGPDDLDVRIEGRRGYSLAQDGPYGVALDLELTEELAAEGIAREVVRSVQDLRKSSGLAVEDRIELWMSSEHPEVAAALETHREWIAGEVLATAARLENPPAHAGATGEVVLEQGRARVGLRAA